MHPLAYRKEGHCAMPPQTLKMKNVKQNQAVITKAKLVVTLDDCDELWPPSETFCVGHCVHTLAGWRCPLAAKERRVMKSSYSSLKMI